MRVMPFSLGASAILLAWQAAHPFDSNSVWPFAPEVISTRVAAVRVDGRFRRYTSMSVRSCDVNSGQLSFRCANSAFMVVAWFHIAFTSTIGCPTDSHCATGFAEGILDSVRP